MAADKIAALAAIDYPAQRLDILLIVEEDDAPTRAAVAAALATVRADFVCVYDAEDRPDPSQLRAALAAFAVGGPRLACVQAPLQIIVSVGNSWIARQFAAEYRVYFQQIAPLLARLKLAAPLGGASNHFRRAALDHVGGWDPYNVTEDADLSYRLAHFGDRIGQIAPPTLETPPQRWSVWRAQRRRWIKGHAHTWLVHMRAPWRTLREMGLANFLVMQILLAGGVISAVVHGPMLAALTVGMIGSLVQADAPALAPEMALLALGYASAALGAAVAAHRQHNRLLARTGLTLPLYWGLSVMAAAPALLELICRPHYWAKTDHTPRAPRLPHRKPPPCPTSKAQPSISPSHAPS